MSAVVDFPVSRDTEVSLAIAELERCTDLVLNALTSKDEVYQLACMCEYDRARWRLLELKRRVCA